MLLMTAHNVCLRREMKKKYENFLKAHLICSYGRNSISVCFREMWRILRRFGFGLLLLCGLFYLVLWRLKIHNGSGKWDNDISQLISFGRKNEAQEIWSIATVREQRVEMSDVRKGLAEVHQVNYLTHTQTHTRTHAHKCTHTQAHTRPHTHKRTVLTHVMEQPFLPLCRSLPHFKTVYHTL